MLETQKTPAILIVDDDNLITDALSFVLKRDFQVRLARDRSQALEDVRQQGSPALALIDLGLPPAPHEPAEGFALIGDLLAIDPELRILVLSGQSDETNARQARTLGAVEFLAKPVNLDHLKSLLHRLIALAPSAGDHDASPGAGLIGASPALQRLREQLRRFGASPHPVLIEGESGTGKELAAAALHRFSARRSEPFLTLNCAAIAPSLVEASLFGYARGAFTGSVGPKTGFFEEAAGGTLFLDEIGEIPPDLQPKLLRVLENGEFQRIGETQTRISRARVVAATNRDLRQEVRSGRFRNDLYHRLSVFTVTTPPLRELGPDRISLFEHFNRQFSDQAGTAPVELDDEARARLYRYSFPGNVRELRNIVIRLTAKHPGRRVSATDLADELDAEFLPGASEQHPQRFDDPADHALEVLRQRPGFSLDAELRRVEAAFIEAAQKLAAGNLSQAARLLGLSRTTLYHRIEALSRQRQA